MMLHMIEPRYFEELLLERISVSGCFRGLRKWFLRKGVPLLRLWAMKQPHGIVSLNGGRAAHEDAVGSSGAPPLLLSPGIAVDGIWPQRHRASVHVADYFSAGTGKLPLAFRVRAIFRFAPATSNNAQGPPSRVGDT
jgi:hypothetical protein